MRDLMASLTRLVRLRLRQDERGVIGVLVAVLIGGGVLTGMGALVVDVGQLYQERAELQNGADAAALGVAKSCALGACTPRCRGQLADTNASSLTGGTPRPWSAVRAAWAPARRSTGQLTSCPPPPSAGTNFVEVYTSTLTGGRLYPASPGVRHDVAGQLRLPGEHRARLCAGRVGRARGRYYRCADDLGLRVGPGTQGTVRASARRTRLTHCPRNPLTRYSALTPRANGGGCGTEPAGADSPVHFGWAADQGGNCTLPVSGSSFPAAAVQSPDAACEQVLQNAQQSRKSRSSSLSTSPLNARHLTP